MVMEGSNRIAGYNLVTRPPWLNPTMCPVDSRFLDDFFRPSGNEQLGPTILPDIIDVKTGAAKICDNTQEAKFTISEKFHSTAIGT